MIVWLTLAAFLTLIEGNERKPELWIALVDAASLGDEILTSVRLEVERLYSPAGVAIVWSEKSLTAAGAHTATVYLMDEMPSSLVSRKRAFGGRPMALALGRAHETSGPVIYVSRRSVAETITRYADKLGPALGRVVGHELGHRFVQRGHTRRGLMRGDLGEGDLVGSGDHLVLSEEEAQRVADVALESSRDR